MARPLALADLRSSSFFAAFDDGELGCGTEADAGVAVVGAGDAGGATEEFPVVLEAAASEDAVAVAFVAEVVACVVVVVVIKMGIVADPLAEVAEHVDEAEGVGAVAVLLGGVVAVFFLIRVVVVVQHPGIGRVWIIAPEKDGLGTCAAGIFPLCLGGQAETKVLAPVHGLGTGDGLFGMVFPDLPRLACQFWECGTVSEFGRDKFTQHEGTKLDFMGGGLGDVSCPLVFLTDGTLAIRVPHHKGAAGDDHKDHHGRLVLHGHDLMGLAASGVTFEADVHVVGAELLGDGFGDGDTGGVGSLVPKLEVVEDRGVGCHVSEFVAR